MGRSQAKTRMRRSGGWRLAALMCAALSWPARADEVSKARVSDIAGSERLQLFAYGKLLDTGTAARVDVLHMKDAMTAQGFYYDPGSNRVIAHQAWVSPVLSYDGNINGGVLRDSFAFRGLMFDTAPQFRAKAGVVGGLAAGGDLRLAWDNGKYLEARAAGEAVWSPGFQIGRVAGNLGLCSRNHISGWTFVDLCHTVGLLSRELGSSTVQTTDLSVSRVFARGGGYHEVTAQLARQAYDTGAQTALTLGWDAVWDQAATHLSLTYAEPIAGQTALRRRIAAGVQWPWRGRNAGISLWQQWSDGGAFLGSPRADRTTGIEVSSEIRPGLTTQFGYVISRSTIDFFRYDQVSVTIRIDGLRW